MNEIAEGKRRKLVNIHGLATGKNGQVSLAAAASTEILAANSERRRLLVKNIDDTNPCYVGFGTVSTANGYKLTTGQEVIIRSTKAVNGIGDGTNAVVVSYLEE